MERKGRAMLFLPVKPRNLGARGLRKNAGKCAGQPSRIREISTIENGAGIRNSSETKTRLSLSLALCVMADDETSTSLDVASHTNEYSIFQDRRGVCCKQGFVSDVETGFKSLEFFFLNFITLLVYIGKRLERCQVELQFLSDRIVSLNNSRI